MQAEIYFRRDFLLEPQFTAGRSLLSAGEQWLSCQRIVSILEISKMRPNSLKI
jgi:hypothetical protein